MIEDLVLPVAIDGDYDNGHHGNNYQGQDHAQWYITHLCIFHSSQDPFLEAKSHLNK